MSKMDLKVIIPFKTGHDVLEHKLICFLSAYFNVHLYILKDEQYEFEESNVQISRFFRPRKAKSRLLNHLYSIYENLIFSLFYISRDDIILFLAYENIPFYLSSFLNRRVFCVEHNNIDELSRSRFKKLIYKRGSRNTISVVFSEVIGAYIKREFKRDYIVISHPALYNECVSNTIGKSDVLDVIVMNIGLTDSLVDEIKRTLCNREGVFVTFKLAESKGEKWCQVPYFKDYREKLLLANCVVIGGIYTYRMSGVMIDALSSRSKVLIVHRSPLVDEYIKLYPSLIRYYRSFDALIEFSSADIDFKEYEAFISNHQLKSSYVKDLIENSNVK